MGVPCEWQTVDDFTHFRQADFFNAFDPFRLIISQTFKFDQNLKDSVQLRLFIINLLANVKFIIYDFLLLFLVQPFVYVIIRTDIQYFMSWVFRNCIQNLFQHVFLSFLGHSELFFSHQIVFGNRLPYFTFSQRLNAVFQLILQVFHFLSIQHCFVLHLVHLVLDPFDFMLFLWHLTFIHVLVLVETVIVSLHLLHLGSDLFVLILQGSDGDMELSLSLTMLEIGLLVLACHLIQLIDFRVDFGFQFSNSVFQIFKLNFLFRIPNYQF